MVTTTLSACSVTEIFGPRPDSSLVELAHQAEADTIAAEGDIARLRHDHAEELYAEIARLCGRDDTGAVPPSCEVEHGAGETQPSPASLQRYYDLLSAVPDESHDLVVDQAIDLAALDTTPLEDTSLGEGDHEIVAGMIEREHAAVHGLKAARAFASRPEAVDDLVDKHQRRLHVLNTALPDAPPAAAGYAFEEAEPGDDYITAQEENLLAAWRAAAADAKDPDTRAFLVAAAADAITAYQEY